MNNYSNFNVETFGHDEVRTRKKNVHYNFVKPRRVEPMQTVVRPGVFYQVCTFRNPHTEKYHMRKFITGEKNQFLSVTDYKLTSKQYKKFFRIKKPFEYRCYDVYDLKNINYPTLSDINTSKSDILTNSYNYTGYAPFK